MYFYKYFDMEKSNFGSHYVGPVLDLTQAPFFWRVDIEV